MVIRSAICKAAETLSSAGIPDSALEARFLTAQVCGISSSALLTALEQPLTDCQQSTLNTLLQRRICGEPLQYLLGEWEFYGMHLFVGEGVLIPRQDTETLVETALQHCRAGRAPAVADLCCGSGCIGLALKAQIRDAAVSGLDISEAALMYARKNAAYHKLDITLLCADVLQQETAARFSALDLIVCNPPYLTDADMEHLQTEVSYEPASALYGGTDGLDFYRRITALWAPALHPGGMLAYEVGAGQAGAVCRMLEAQRFCEIRTIPDLAGIDRVVCGKRCGADGKEF